MNHAITIYVNGESRAISPEITVEKLLVELGVNAGRIAIERNQQILPRQLWSETPVAANDRYEIVHFVGGG